MFHIIQGSHLLDEFMSILGGVSKTSKVECKADWWMKRAKLDKDMEVH